MLSEVLSGLESKSSASVAEALATYKDRRLVRSAAVQGLSRFASDIIIRGFDTPAKVVDGRFENFNYAGIVSSGPPHRRPPRAATSRRTLSPATHHSRCTHQQHQPRQPRQPYQPYQPYQPHQPHQPHQPAR